MSQSPGGRLLAELLDTDRRRRRAAIAGCRSVRLAAILAFDQEGGTVTTERRMAVRAQAQASILGV